MTEILLGAKIKSRCWECEVSITDMVPSLMKFTVQQKTNSNHSTSKFIIENGDSATWASSNFYAK